MKTREIVKNLMHVVFAGYVVHLLSKRNENITIHAAQEKLKRVLKKM